MPTHILRAASRPNGAAPTASLPPPGIVTIPTEELPLLHRPLDAFIGRIQPAGAVEYGHGELMAYAGWFIGRAQRLTLLAVALETAGRALMQLFVLASCFAPGHPSHPHRSHTVAHTGNLPNEIQDAPNSRGINTCFQR